MRNFLAYILLLFPLISGCAEQHIIEDLGFIHGVAFDLNTENPMEEGKLIMTAVLPQVDQSADENTEILTAKAHSGKEGRTKFDRKTDRIVASGQLRSVLFNTDLAKEGLMDLVDSLDRDTRIGLNVKVIVVNGSGKELLFGEYPRHPRTGRYIYDLIDKEAKSGSIIDMTLYQFSRDYFDDGIDPVSPILKKGEEEIILDGIALFNEDKYVGKLSPKDGRTFKMLHGAYEGKDVSLKLAVEEGDFVLATLSIIESKRSVVVDSTSKLNIHLDVRGMLDEYTGPYDLSVRDSQEKIEEQLEEYIQKEADEIISKLQELKVDSLGLGAYVRNKSRYQYWQELNWKETIYPESEITVSVDVKLKGLGSIK